MKNLFVVSSPLIVCLFQMYDDVLFCNIYFKLLALLVIVVFLYCSLINNGAIKRNVVKLIFISFLSYCILEMIYFIGGMHPKAYEGYQFVLFRFIFLTLVYYVFILTLFLAGRVIELGGQYI